MPIVEGILGPEARRPPEHPDERRKRLEQTTEGRLLLETSELSPLEFVEREFEHPVVKAGLLFFNGLREVDLRLSGFGHHIPALLASPAKAQMCLGGAARLAEALAAAVREAGGEIRTSCEPRRIVLERGRVAGVETTDGELIRAKFVASSLNPQQTFIDLLAAPGELGERARKFEYNLLAPLFALNLVLKAPPRYRAAEKRAELDRAFMVILGLERFEQFSDIVRHHEEGRIPPTVMWGASPTVFDPSQAPPGGHTAFMWEKLPYRLRERHWDDERDRHAANMLDLWTEYAPHLADDVLGWFARSPLDTERSLPNMRGGDLLVGSFANGQLGYDRPFRGAGQYRTAIEGLYLCGSSCHPGGNITGLPGYNSAQVLLADLGLAKFGPRH